MISRQIFITLCATVTLTGLSSAAIDREFDITGKWFCALNTDKDGHVQISRTVMQYLPNETYKSSTQYWHIEEYAGEIVAKARVRTTGQGAYSFDGETLSSIQMSRDFAEVTLEEADGMTPQQQRAFEMKAENKLQNSPLNKQVSTVTVISPTKFLTQSHPNLPYWTCNREKEDPS